MRMRQNVMWSLARVGLLCLVAGMVDAYGYVTLGHVFAANMTGNTVLLAITAVEGELAASVNYVLTICAFTSGAVLGAVLRRASGRPYVPLVLAAFLLAAISLGALNCQAMLGLIAIVMGLQAASISKFGATSLQTIVITGPIVRLAEGLVDLLWVGKGAKTREAAEASAHNGLAWITYGVGAALGAAAVGVTGTPLVLAVPAGLLLAAAAELAAEPQTR
jgi:uncharacterized membrane protein YoaK (UPF0700 family)